jgi:hypothetical protein
MPLSDAGKFIWNSGASSYIFVKDYTNILELTIDPHENYERADDGTLRMYRSATFKKSIELQFEDVGGTQRNQFATIWKQNLNIDFYRKQTDTTKLGVFAWVGGFNFAYSEWGMYYKELYSGRIILEEI